MKRYSWLFLFIVTFCTQSLSAQDRKDPFPQWNLRMNPFSFLDVIDAGIMVGVNYRWTERWSASLEPGWIFYTHVRNNNGQFEHPIGFKLKADGRYHMRWDVWGMEPYIGLEFHFKNTSTNRLATFGMNCQAGNCAFFQTDYYKEKKREIGGAIKWGTITSISQNDRWMLEYYGGLGVKLMKFKDTDIPVGGSFMSLPDRNFLQGAFSENNSDRFYMPHMPGGIKLIYILQ